MNCIKTSIIVIVGLLLHTFPALAAKGYKMKLEFKQPIHGEYVYLAKYYAKAMPNVYKVDSVKVNNTTKSVVFFQQDEMLGGVYLVLFNDRRNYFEVLIDNGYDFTINIDTTLVGVPITSFINSKANDAYWQLNDNYIKLRTDIKSYQSQNENPDKSVIWDRYKATYKENIMLTKAFSDNDLFTKIVYASTPPPEPVFTDSADYQYKIKEQYWSHFDLSDDRLIHTPILDNKLRQYMDRYVMSYQPDSVIYEFKKLMYYAEGTKEISKFLLIWFTDFALNSKYIGLDEVFVMLVEDYYMQNKAPWLDAQILDSYIKKAHALAPNVIGQKGANIKLKELYSLKDVDLYSFNAKYTMILFWSIDCGHCLEEVPRLKQLYEDSLANLGVKVFSVPTGSSQKDIISTVEKLGVKYWQHAIDIDGSSDFLEKYDAYAKPKVYMLDNDKIIRGKLLHHGNIMSFMNYIQKEVNLKQ
jgi:thiol-disulfide isomerase/thioredoxin